MGLLKLQQSLDYVRTVFENILRRVLKIIDQQEQQDPNSREFKSINECKQRNAEAFEKARYVLDLLESPENDLKLKIIEGKQYFREKMLQKYMQIDTHAHKADDQFIILE